ncbi:flagellar hook protein FlgE [Anaerophilus nitritogenes]|uniref:flagellar hook protein FlgE n=1 Tax=Anaerophilus nitritogenes TaxID=2498136 RepID=UPI00101B9B0B|nr:flagellar hook protein FlgE [Anaerophilus nitritogenes]
MMRSMYSAVSGLGVHQSKMDVIGNNIANVNTVGFKKGTMTFKEAFNQTLRGGSAPQEGRGGTNPQQIGLGVSIGAMNTIHTTGTPETTGSATDLMISGDGFFMVSDDVNFLNKSYTRAGNFGLDRDGNLVTSEGLKVLGYRAESIGEKSELKSTLEGLVISKAMTFPAKVTGATSADGNELSKTKDVLLEGNINADTGLKAEVVKKDNAGATEYFISKEQLIGKSTTTVVYDQLGGAHEVKIEFRRKMEDNNYWNDPDGKVAWTGTEDPKIEDLIKPNEWEVVITPVGSETIEINSAANAPIDCTFADGNIVLPQVNIGVYPPAGKDPNNKFITGAEGFNFNLSFQDENGKAAVTQFSNESTLTATRKTGYKQGSLDEFSIGSDGSIEGSFTNGQRSVIGRVAIAKFKNPSGLLKTSDNLFKDTENSGTAIVGKPGESGFAAIAPGRLEMSNVDLGKEFTDMITTQRGFQANSRVITTTDEMLQELVNIKR